MKLNIFLYICTPAQPPPDQEHALSRCPGTVVTVKADLDWESRNGCKDQDFPENKAISICVLCTNYNTEEFGSYRRTVQYSPS